MMKGEGLGHSLHQENAIKKPEQLLRFFVSV